MKEVYNFSAGPATLPKSVLIKVQEELLSYNDSGMSVLELSHRGNDFEPILEDCKKLLKELLNIPEGYHIVFTQGGASLAFYMIALNYGKKKVAYVDTGVWSDKAIEQARLIPNLEVDIIATSKEDKYLSIPKQIKVASNYDYVHITTNNTIEGTCFFNHIETNGVPLIADMSSNLLSSEYDVSKFDLIYAGAQKNLGPAGVTIVIIKDELLNQGKNNLPHMLDYKTYVKNNSMYNTPPTFSIYVTKLVLEWLKSFGGVKAIEKYNQDKAKLLYDFLDNSKVFYNPINKEDRSLVNIPF
ncbi:MAG: 3-phosphoserine/phosphohydroxythreonine transaminase, partial [Bacilli bacterium]